jgi:hypothetical protein
VEEEKSLVTVCDDVAVLESGCSLALKWSLVFVSGLFLVSLFFALMGIPFSLFGFAVGQLVCFCLFEWRRVGRWLTNTWSFLLRHACSLTMLVGTVVFVIAIVADSGGLLVGASIVGIWGMTVMRAIQTENPKAVLTGSDHAKVLLNEAKFLLSGVCSDLRVSATDKSVLVLEENPTCGVCNEKASGPSIMCPRCFARYHVDCAKYVHVCATFGCGKELLEGNAGSDQKPVTPSDAKSGLKMEEPEASCQTASVVQGRRYKHFNNSGLS